MAELAHSIAGLGHNVRLERFGQGWSSKLLRDGDMKARPVFGPDEHGRALITHQAGHLGSADAVFCFDMPTAPGSALLWAARSSKGWAVRSRTTDSADWDAGRHVRSDDQLVTAVTDFVKTMWPEDQLGSVEVRDPASADYGPSAGGLPESLMVAAARLTESLGWVLFYERDRLVDELAAAIGQRDAAESRVRELERKLESLEAAEAEPDLATRAAWMAAIAALIAALLNPLATVYSINKDAETTADTAVSATIDEQPSRLPDVFLHVDEVTNCAATNL